MFADDGDGGVITGALLIQGSSRKFMAKVLRDLNNRAGWSTHIVILRLIHTRMFQLPRLKDSSNVETGKARDDEA